MNYSQIRSSVSRSTIISSIGDFTSVYAYYLLFEKISNNSISSGNAILSRSISALITLFVFRSIIHFFSYKKLIQICQLTLGTITVFLTYSIIAKSFLNMNFLFLISIVQFSLFNIYSQSLGSYSKYIEDINKNGIKNLVKSNQAQLELAIRIGQIGGPFVFFLLLNYFKDDLWIAFAFDGLTFIASAFLFRNLPDYKIIHEKTKFSFGINKVLSKNRIGTFFSTRTFYILNVSFINIFIFQLIKTFNLSSRYVPLIDAISACGSATMLYILSRSHLESKVHSISKIKNLDHWNLVIFGGILFSLCYVIVSSGILNFWTTLFFFILGGAGNGAQMTGYRQILNDSTNQKEFNEVSGFAILHARVIESFVTFLFIILSRHISSDLSFALVITTSLIALIAAYLAKLSWDKNL